MSPWEWLSAPAPTWLVIAVMFAIILNVYDAAKNPKAIHGPNSDCVVCRAAHR
jgi:hypothetical protein